MTSIVSSPVSAPIRNDTQIVAPIPVARNQTWSYWASLAGFLAAQGGYFLAIALVWAGRSSETWYDIALRINVLIGAIGFWLMRRAIAPSAKAPG